METSGASSSLSGLDTLANGMENEMPKPKNQLVTAAARDAGNQLAIRDPLANYMKKITDGQRSEELSGTFTGVIVRGGKITDVVAANGAVKIEE